jgi:hypothetical protein
MGVRHAHHLQTSPEIARRGALIYGNKFWVTSPLEHIFSISNHAIYTRIDKSERWIVWTVELVDLEMVRFQSYLLVAVDTGAYPRNDLEGMFRKVISWARLTDTHWSFERDGLPHDPGPSRVVCNKLFVETNHGYGLGEEPVGKIM